MLMSIPAATIWCVVLVLQTNHEVCGTCGTCGVTYIGETERRAVQRLVVGGPVCLTGCPASAAGITDTWKATDHINTYVYLTLNFTKFQSCKVPTVKYFYH